MELLSRSGLSKRELARRLGMHTNTVSRWTELPGYARAYLTLYVAIKDLAGAHIGPRKRA